MRAIAVLAALALTTPRAALAAAAAPAAPAPALTVRLKDIAQLENAESNELTGVGLVTGLNGTGDSSDVNRELVRNLLERFKITIDPDDADAENVAVVTVTARLPAYQEPGTRIGCTVSSLLDAESLRGGVLLTTPLLGADRQTYALASGSVSLGGGFSAGGAAATVQKGHPAAGRVPNGAKVVRRVPVTQDRDVVTFCLHKPDATTAVRLAEAINKVFADSATARDGGTVQVRVPPEYRGAARRMPLVARLEEVRVTPDTPARIVINERTGTVVGGEHVRISRAFVAHGSIVFITKETPEVSQPPPLSDGETVVVPRTELEVREPGRRVVLMAAAPTVADVVRALNALGVTPNDIIAILQALREKGALHAELKVM